MHSPFREDFTLTNAKFRENKTLAKISDLIVSSMARGLNLGQSLHLSSYEECMQAEKTGESAQMIFLIANNSRSLLITPESSIQKGVK